MKQGKSTTRKETVPPACPDERVAAIDFIKAFAIVAVVLAHAGLPGWDPRFTDFERWVRLLLPAYHVPSFLFVSGFLYFTPHSVGLATLRRRLARVVLPYIVASCIVQLLGLSGARGLGAVVFQLVSGSALGIYYFVILLLACIAFSWPLSRMSIKGQHVLLIALCTYSLICMIHPALSPRESGFWGMRDPLHYVGYFLVGWLARCHSGASAWFRENFIVVAAASFGGVVTYVAANVGHPPAAVDFVLLRALYTMSIIGLISSATISAGVPHAVRLLSDTTYPIYLYHRLFQIVLLTYTAEWPVVLRVATLAAAGLAGGIAMARIARRAFGSRSRLIVGA